MTEHRISKIPEYRAWIDMKARCLNPNRPQFKDWGGRGISICSEWQNSFIAFYKDMGKRPCKEMTLDRIDNDGNYEPGNCRWATKLTQRLNSRAKKCKIIAINKSLGIELGIISHIGKFAESFALNKGSISLCLKGLQEGHRGWIFEKVL